MIIHILQSLLIGNVLRVTEICAIKSTWNLIINLQKEMRQIDSKFLSFISLLLYKPYKNRSQDNETWWSRGKFTLDSDLILQNEDQNLAHKRILVEKMTFLSLTGISVCVRWLSHI